MSFATETEIANAALSTLGEREIRDYATDTDPVAIEVRRWFEVVAEEELMQFDWPFALVRVTINPDVTAPAFGWVSRYEIPRDCVRFLPVTESGEDSGISIPHEVEGGFILADTSGEIRLRYVSMIATPADWPQNFQSMFIAALARKLAENVTGLSNALGTAEQRYQEVSQRVRRFEGRQTGTAAPQYSTSYLDMRT